MRSTFIIFVAIKCSLICHIKIGCSDLPIMNDIFEPLIPSSAMFSYFYQYFRKIIFSMSIWVLGKTKQKKYTFYFVEEDHLIFIFHANQGKTKKYGILYWLGQCRYKIKLFRRLQYFFYGIWEQKWQ